MVNSTLVDQDWWKRLHNVKIYTNRAPDGKHAYARVAVYLHRLITKCPAHLQVDHLNNDKMDNRRCNLQCVSRLQNLKRRDARGKRKR